MSCWPGAQLALASAIPLFCWYLLLNSWEMWSLTGHVFISQVMRKIISSLIAFQELLWICFVMFCHAELLLFFYFRVSLNLSRLPSSKTLSLCKICLWQMLLIIFFFFFFLPPRLICDHAGLWDQIGSTLLFHEPLWCWGWVKVLQFLSSMRGKLLFSTNSSNSPRETSCCGFFLVLYLVLRRGEC